MSISYIIQFKAKSNKQADFHNIMNNVKSELPEVKGCISVVIHHSVENASSFLMVETWESKEHHQQHVESLVSSGVWDHIAGHLSEDPVGDYYKLI